MSIRDFDFLAAMDAEDEAEARAQADAPPAKRRKGAVFVSRAHPDGRPDTGTYAKPEADDTAVMDEASFRRTVLFAYIAKFTREVAFKEKRRMAERVYIDTATDEQLADRMRTYNKGVDREDFLELYRDKKNWTHFEFKGKPLVAILDIGEIVHPETTQLLGSFHLEKIRVLVDRLYQRSNLILTASGKLRGIDESADHIDPKHPLNDSLSNLRWANSNIQNYNQLRPVAIRSLAQTLKFTKGDITVSFLSPSEAAKHFGVSRKAVCQAIKYGYRVQKWTVRLLNSHSGCRLPMHTKFNDIELTDIGEYRTSKTGIGSTWRAKEKERATICYIGQYLKIHRIMVECILGRELGLDEEVDHVNGNPKDADSFNLWPMSHRINNVKIDQQFRVGVLNGISFFFLSAHDAGQLIKKHSSSISKATSGRQLSVGGYTWHIASVAELERIFDEVDKLALKSWGEILTMLEEYDDHHYYDVMKAQAILSKEYAEKLAAWRATLGKNAVA